MEDVVDEMTVMEKLCAAVERLEAAAAGLLEKHEALEVAAGECVGKIVATVEGRETELERKLEEAERMIAELKASASAPAGGRKTVVAGTMLAKAAEASDAGALDAALSSLSIEQRIAVKSEMLRAGLLR